MIQRIDDQYILASNESTDEVRQCIQAKQVKLQVVGSVTERLADIRERLDELKKVKERNMQQMQGKQSIFAPLNQNPPSSPCAFEFTLMIPTEILELDKRTQALEAMIHPNEISRAKSQKKGTIINRIKTLHKQLQKLTEKKSNETIINNVQQYSAYLDSKEEHLKSLFLNDLLSKTQGMSEEVGIIEAYLQELNKIQTRISSLMPVEGLVKNHNEILKKRGELSRRIEVLFERMVSEYTAVCKEIDQVQV